jgi:hypothetical protein
MFQTIIKKNVKMSIVVGILLFKMFLYNGKSAATTSGCSKIYNTTLFTYNIFGYTYLQPWLSHSLLLFNVQVWLWFEHSIGSIHFGSLPMQATMIFLVCFPWQIDTTRSNYMSIPILKLHLWQTSNNALWWYKQAQHPNPWH